MAGQKFKDIPLQERSGNVLIGLFKEYKYSLPEVEGSVGFCIFHGIVNLLTICGESKTGFSTYYVKFYHGKNVFDAMLDRIEEMGLISVLP